jgi:hypothetical protein
MNQIHDLLEEFIEWAKNRDEGVFYIFDDTEKAISEFLKERE